MPSQATDAAPWVMLDLGCPQLLRQIGLLNVVNGYNGVSRLQLLVAGRLSSPMWRSVAAGAAVRCGAVQCGARVPLCV